MINYNNLKKIPYIRAIIILIANFGLIYLTIGATILGGGIVPVPMSKIYICAAITSLIVAIISMYVRRWVAFATILILSLLNISGNERIFTHYLHTALNVAQTYGAEVARVVTDIHNQTGKWPETLEDIPQDIRPKLDPKFEKNYHVNGKNGVYELIGGLHFTYGADKDGNRLIRLHCRGWYYKWDWEKSTWQNLDPETF